MSKTLREWAIEAYSTTKNNGFHEGDSDPVEKLPVCLMNTHSEANV